MSNKTLNCPIRGELKVKEKAKDDLTFTEEYRRIECVKELLNLGYPKERFDFEKIVWDNLGNSGRNNIRADIVIYDDDKKEKIFLIAEIKRDDVNKKNETIETQLKPPLIKNKATYGIYYDGVENVFLDAGGGL
ncbi:MULTISPECIES: type I restriction enzyme HsdR N-terminal domain-containing protein [unclassified Campylobacter]|uniref:type I restriction enzyme HsdR N-terminal domain-containing protein n=1 Tax=unclassified Campylobacter TaxID=2593542 RepID=UPI0022E9EC7B|nr:MULTISPECIES: type I restriction enzyme HsdR N-terminal domain-containing protein [unclassified Campylobacter]MDA3053790.1 type I restriction enzyme HsdR N-terminal domain-containing protein [Campylobacter sp. VBCF_07 NA4]MDA3060321.1 type I restriction enzyme HsdR N-terminal domain-containing protein [Campylobacter sp. VBCF_02 NA5]MDA3069831.1 type I restriction enzyme HsdR N-terminal domain-containing protein [Campylobacter sp. VBCF_08 NA3]WBR54842.1 type I restriction enzyme HsdR N-termin